MLSPESLEELIDPLNPPQDAYELEFFYTTLELLEMDEKKERKKRKKVELTDGAKMMSLTPFVVGVHEGIHALTAAFLGCRVEGVGYEGLSFYILTSSTDPIKATIIAFSPHVLAIPSIYYGYFKKKNYWLTFLAPTLAEFFPYELFQDFGDFLNIAKIVAPGFSTILKYVLAGSYLIFSYFICRYVYNRKRKIEEESEGEE